MRTFKEYMTESETGERAKAMGLQYMKVGRWGKDGVSLYRQKHGQLIPVKKNAGKTPHHVHDSEDLLYLKNTLHHDEFQSIKPKEDDCLTLQVAHTAAMALGISPKAILDQYHPDTKWGGNLAQIISDIQDKVVINGKKIKINVDRLKDIDDALDTVKQGHPVICMVKTFGSIMNSKMNHTGELDFQKKDSSVDLYHALMLFGYDKKQGKALFRDSDSSGYKNGFLKVDMKHLKKDKDAISGFIKLDATFEDA
jgi:hypothetical protein